MTWIRRVLVPFDGSERSTHALEYALREFPGRDVVVLHVIDPLEAGYSAGVRPFGRAEEWYERSRLDAEDLFEAARELAAEHDATVETALELGRPAQTIVEYAADEDVDQIVLGSHGRAGVSRILLGSVAESVVRRATVPVTVVR